MSAADTTQDDDKAMLAVLTPEERAAMQDELSEEEKALMAAVAQAGNDEEEEGEGEGDEPSGQEAKSDGEEPSSQETATESQGDDAAAKPEISPAAQDGKAAVEKPHVYKADLPEDYQQRMDDLAAQREALAAKFKAGEMEFDDYRAQDATLLEERAQLGQALTKAEVFQEMNRQNLEKSWNAAVLAFTDAVLASEGVDYRADPAGQKKLDGFIQAITADPDNAELSLREILDKAHGMVKMVYKPVTRGTEPAADKQAGAEPNKPGQDQNPDKKAAAAKPDKSRKPDLSGLPATLAHVPGGEGPGDLGGGEFSDLDGLDGIALEQAIAKMSPAQRDKYAALAA